MNLVKHLLTILIVLFLSATSIASAQDQSDKPVFVLVHGAWHGGWCWQYVSQYLIEKDYRVYTPGCTTIRWVITHIFFCKKKL